MTGDKMQVSRLFSTTVIEGRTELDEKFDRGYNCVTSLTSNLSEKEAHDILNKALDDRKSHDDICIGLLVSILSDPSNAVRHYHDLTLLSRDSLKGVTDVLIQIISERYHRLLDVSRTQLLWLVREVIKTGVNNAEGIVWNLLRQIAGGDVSPKNVWLAESLVDILRDHRPWLDKFCVIVASVAYTYLRVLEDHQGPQFATLRQKEVAFVVGLLRERFLDCMKIGRDLVRVLQNIAKIPEIELFWRDLLHNPTSLSPSFTGIIQLFQMRTSRRFFVVRLTPEMEKKMFFLCTDVKFGTQKRYQEWFQRQYLNTPESQTLRCDLIRFIIGCIHPSNEVLCSDIIPRWAVIGWLLSSCTSPVATANAKLSLFYDWLFYNTDTDNIMNIEPGILVMYHSLRPHPVLTTSLLDFLCRIIPNFHPSLTDKVKAGVYKSLSQILEKRVVQSLDPLFDNPRMDLELRKLVRDSFPEFCAASAAGVPQELKQDDFISPLSSNSMGVTKMDLMAETGLDFSGAVGLSTPSVALGGGTDHNNDDHDVNHSTNHATSSEDDAAFSEEEEAAEEVEELQQQQHRGRSSRSKRRNFTYSSSTSSSSKSATNTPPPVPVPPAPPNSSRLRSEDAPPPPTALPHDGCVVHHASATAASSRLNSNNSTFINSSVSDDVMNCNSVVVAEVNNSSNSVGDEDDDDRSGDIKPVVVKLGSSDESSSSSSLASATRRTDFNKHLEFLEKDTRTFLEDLLLAKDQNTRCNIVQKICDLIFSEDLDEEEAQHLAACLSYLLTTDSVSEHESLLPPKITPESLDLSLNRPLYVLFDNLITLTEDDHRRQSLLFLLTQLHKIDASMGYHFLYFLKASMVRRERDESQEESSASMQIYKDLCKASGHKDFSGFIQKDIQMCCEKDPRLISWVVPDVYQTFPKQTVGNVDLLRLVLERLDSSQLHDLVCLVLQGSLQLFDNNSFSNILEKSLQWETVEQVFLWQLARAHEIPVDCCLSVLPKLKFSSHTDSVPSTHGEALSNILMMLRRESPSENLLKHLFLRELKPSDPTVATILQYWVQRYEDKMAKIVSDLVSAKQQVNQQPSPNKRKRNQGASKSGSTAAHHSSSAVPLDQVLSHLNHLRTACDQTKFFALSTMQEALLGAQALCSEAQKRKYSDLFALIDEDEDERVASPPPPPPSETHKRLKSGRGRRPKSKKKRCSDTEEESSEDEEAKKPSRKRKKNAQLNNSDSD